MNLIRNLSIQALIFGLMGGLVGYFLGPKLPANTAADLAQALGNISVIAGSLLGWSVGLLSQSRGLVKEIDYESARHLFRQLGEIQRELIWRWGIVFSCSILVIICSVVMKMPTLGAESFVWLMTVVSVLLGVALGFIFYLFERMLGLTSLKTKLDEFEHDELRKKRLLAEDTNE